MRIKDIKNKTEIKIFAGILLASIAFLWVGYLICRPETTPVQGGMFLTARVTSVGRITLDEFSLDGGNSTISNKNIEFHAALTSGSLKGQTISAAQYIDYMYPSQPKQVEKGDRIIVSYAINSSTGTGAALWQFYEHDRSFYLFILLAVFFAAILFIGRLKGLATILSLVFTAIAIFCVYLPAILKGYNIYLSTSLIAIYIIGMSLTLLNGLDKKTFCAVAGNCGGVAVAGVVALLMNELIHVTGVLDESYVFLMDLNPQAPIDLRAIVWASIMIGSLGAVMDVAMTIASAMHELAQTMENRSFSRMFASGMNIGRDAIGTMTNTLILAYIGGSLAMVLLHKSNSQSLLFLLNLETISVEILQAVVGSLGILFAVPVTTLIAAYLYNKAPPTKEPTQAEPIQAAQAEGDTPSFQNMKTFLANPEAIAHFDQGQQGSEQE